MATVSSLSIKKEELAGLAVPEHWNYPKISKLVAMLDFTCIILITVSPIYLGWEWVPDVKNKTPTVCNNKGKETGPISEHYCTFGFLHILSEENLSILYKYIQDF